ncbi:MAG TPA: HprK-related kinase A [Stellaceae bacterium]|nr:HprK-related kinase A [Stellaceae bacterium]
MAHLFLRTGPFTVHVETSCEEVIDGVTLLYDPACVLRRPAFCDYHVQIWQPPLRRHFRPQAVFLFDGHAPFLPGPRRHASPMLEWGMNWVIATTAHQFLIVHAAVVERNGLALVLPAPPGSGKSTLCAGLVFRGWRLLSDELALLAPGTGQIIPLVRPISLKNESIDVIRRFAPGATIGPATMGSTKGTIALVKPPSASIAAIDEPATPRWIAFPRFQSGAALELTPRSKARTFVELGESAMNYNILGETGFNVMSDLIERCDIGDFVYSNLDEAVSFFTRIADEAIPFAEAGS